MMVAESPLETPLSFASAPATAMVGEYNGSTCFGIGAAVAISAKHTGAGSTATFGGTARTVLARCEHPTADIQLLLLSGTALPEYHALPTAAISSGDDVMMGGFGFTATVNNAWTGSRAERWVTNKAEAVTSSEVQVEFSDPDGVGEDAATTNEGHACMNDSGGVICSTNGATAHAVIVHALADPTDSTYWGDASSSYGRTRYAARTHGVSLIPHVGWIKQKSVDPDAPAVLSAVYNSATKVLTLTFDSDVTDIGAVAKVQVNDGGSKYEVSGAPDSGDGTATLVYTLTLNGASALASGHYAMDAGLYDNGTTTNEAIDTAPYTAISVSVEPVCSSADTAFNTQTDAVLYIAVGSGDTLATHFKITEILYGTLYKNNGTTEITNDSYITVAEGAAGLRFTPRTNFAGTASFKAASSQDGAGTGLSATSDTAYIVVSGSGTMAKPVISGVSAAIGDDTTATAAILEATVTFADSILADATLLNDAIGIASPNDGFVVRLPNSVATGANALNSATFIENPHLISTTYFAAITTSVTAGRTSVLADMFENSDGGENNDAAADIATSWVANNTMTPAGDGSITFLTTDWTGTDAISGKRTRWVNWTAPITGAYRFSVQGTIATTTSSTFTVYTKANGVSVGTVTSAGASMDLTVQLDAGVEYVLAFFAFQVAGTRTVGLNCTTLAAPTYVSPANGATSVELEPTLDWSAVTGATGYDVYLDTVNPPTTQVAAATAATDFATDPLTAGTTYYWRVDTIDGTGTATGDVWSFTTATSGGFRTRSRNYRVR